MWEWLTEKAKFPRFVWAIFGLAILVVGCCVAYRVLTDENVLIEISDKYKLAMQHHEEASQNRDASIVMLEEMHKRFDELHRKLEDMKRKAPTPEIKHKIDVTQTSLTAFKKDFNGMPKLPPNWRKKVGSHHIAKK